MFKLLKWIWIVWVTITCLSLCGTQKVPEVCAKEAKESIYVVKEGDTLATIAGQYGTTWRNLWELNQDIIKDPNLIFPDQKIYVSGTPKPVKVRSWVSSDEFEDIITTLMFNKLYLSKDTPLDYFLKVSTQIEQIIKDVKDGRPMKARKALSSLNSNLIAIEAYELAYQITEVYKKDPEMACILVALAWQETGFHNRRGKAGEVGFYQVLPQTLKGIHGKTLYLEVKDRIENEPEFATEFTIWYLKTLEGEGRTMWQIFYRYNGHPEYAGQVVTKYNIIRNMVRR